MGMSDVCVCIIIFYSGHINQMEFDTQRNGWVGKKCLILAMELYIMMESITDCIDILKY